MSAREIQDQKAIAREIFVRQTARASADVSASSLREDTISIQFFFWMPRPIAANPLPVPYRVARGSGTHYLSPAPA
jgi:hypothetical protein